MSIHPVLTPTRPPAETTRVVFAEHNLVQTAVYTNGQVTPQFQLNISEGIAKQLGLGVDFNCRGSVSLYPGHNAEQEWVDVYPNANGDVIAKECWSETATLPVYVRAPAKRLGIVPTHFGQKAVRATFQPDGRLRVFLPRGLRLANDDAPQNVPDAVFLKELSRMLSEAKTRNIEIRDNGNGGLEAIRTQVVNL
jgi:hypothetical protein